MFPVNAPSESEVKRNLRNQGEAEQPHLIFADITGMHSPLYQEKTIDGKSQPPDYPQNPVLRKQHRPCMVNEHTSHGNAFQSKPIDAKYFLFIFHLLLSMPLSLSRGWACRTKDRQTARAHEIPAPGPPFSVLLTPTAHARCPATISIPCSQAAQTSA